jgi:glycosyltransferase involved in cell wall biosynthesis
MIYIVNLIKKNINFHVTSQEEALTVKSTMKNIENIFLIPNFFDIPPQKEFNKKNQILFIGRIHPIKAIENLILACNHSDNFKNLNFKLLIIGDYNNKYGKMLQKLVKNLNISDNIVFINQIVDLIYKNKIYSESFCTILPSHSENFGNVVVESLSNSTFVIASKGTPWQILEDNNAGFWVENDVNTLSRTIDKVLSKNPNEILMLSNNAYNLAYNKFSINNNFSFWTNCYNKILNINLKC